MRRLATVLAIGLVLGVLGAGCSGGGDDEDSSSSTAPGGGTTTQDTSGPDEPGGANDTSQCSKWDGKPNVVRTFCDGPGSIVVSIDRTDYEVKGGTCQTGGGFNSFNAGVVVGPDFEGAKPDYAGVNLPEKAGAFEDIVIAVTVGGKSYSVTPNKGTATASAASFSGTDRRSGVAIEGALTCK